MSTSSGGRLKELRPARCHRRVVRAARHRASTAPTPSPRPLVEGVEVVAMPIIRGGGRAVPVDVHPAAAIRAERGVVRHLRGGLPIPQPAGAAVVPVANLVRRVGGEKGDMQRPIGGDQERGAVVDGRHHPIGIVDRLRRGPTAIHIPRAHADDAVRRVVEGPLEPGNHQGIRRGERDGGMQSPPVAGEGDVVHPLSGSNSRPCCHRRHAGGRRSPSRTRRHEAGRCYPPPSATPSSP